MWFGFRNEKKKKMMVKNESFTKIFKCGTKAPINMRLK